MGLDKIAPLSFREAAKVLGLDRNLTIPALVKSGQLRAVQWGREIRIPREEVMRVAREGFVVGPKKVQRRAPKKPAAGVGAQILALPHGRKKT